MKVLGKVLGGVIALVCLLWFVVVFLVAIGWFIAVLLRFAAPFVVIGVIYLLASRDEEHVAVDDYWDPSDD